MTVTIHYNTLFHACATGALKCPYQYRSHYPHLFPDELSSFSFSPPHIQPFTQPAAQAPTHLLTLTFNPTPFSALSCPATLPTTTTTATIVTAAAATTTATTPSYRSFMTSNSFEQSEFMMKQWS